MTIGRWGTISFQVPDFLEDVRQSINDVADFLITVLDVALIALNLIKTFALAFLNPILLIIESIMALLDDFLADFRQIGIYLTGDWALLDYPDETQVQPAFLQGGFENLRGGYAEYERRMLSRLTDITDPTRPDVSTSTTCLAAFFYLSVDTSAIYKLRSFLESLSAFFNFSFSTTNPQPTPIITQVQYGNQAGSFSNLFSFDTEPPEKLQLTWKLSKTTAQYPFSTFAPLAPSGFIVTVGTLPEPIPLKFTRVISDSTTSKNTKGQTQQARSLEGDCVDSKGDPIFLYGGFDHLKNITSYNSGVSSAGTVQAGEVQIFGLLPGDQILDLSLLKNDDTHFFQKSFLMQSDGLPIFDYTKVLDLNDLPHHAEVSLVGGKVVLKDLGVASTYYIRISSCDQRVLDTGHRWDLEESLYKGNLLSNTLSLRLEENITSTSISPWSPVKSFTKPSHDFHDFVRAVSSALYLLILSRIDLSNAEEVGVFQDISMKEDLESGVLFLPNVTKGKTNLESYRSVLNSLFPEGYASYIGKAYRDPVAFKSDIKQRVSDYVKRIYDTGGFNTDSISFVKEQSELLRNTKLWEIVEGAGFEEAATQIRNLHTDATLYDVFESDLAYFGFGSNPKSIGLPPESAESLNVHVQAHEPGFFSKETIVEFVSQADAQEVPSLVSESRGLVKNTYIRFSDSEEGLSIPPVFGDFLLSLQTVTSSDSNQAKVLPTNIAGSADNSPVLYVNSYDSDRFVAFARSLFLLYQNGILFAEARTVLALALGPVTKSPKEGEWQNIRFFDWLPGLEDFFDILRNWLESLAESFRSITEAIVAYITFLENRVIELQQLIARINAILQSLLSFAIGLPAFSGMMAITQGTYGVISALTNAENKPQDSSLSYGGGACIVVPFAPSILLDLLSFIDAPPTGDEALVSISNSVIGGSASIPETPEIPEVL